MSDPLDMKGKTVIVTGGSGGVGQSIQLHRHAPAEAVHGAADKRDVATQGEVAQEAVHAHAGDEGVQAQDQVQEPPTAVHHEQPERRVEQRCARAEE